MATWTCPYCGHSNRLRLSNRKICENCGKETHRDLPEEDDPQDNPGYY